MYVSVCFLCCVFVFAYISNDVLFCFALFRTSQLFWISNDDSPTIVRSYMDGSNQHIVLTSKSTKFGDIAIDTINEKLVFYSGFLITNYTPVSCQLQLYVAQ